MPGFFDHPKPKQDTDVMATEVFEHASNLVQEIGASYTGACGRLVSPGGRLQIRDAREAKENMPAFIFSSSSEKLQEVGKALAGLGFQRFDRPNEVGFSIPNEKVLEAVHNKIARPAAPTHGNR